VNVRSHSLRENGIGDALGYWVESVIGLITTLNITAIKLWNVKLMGSSLFRFFLRDVVNEKTVGVWTCLMQKQIY
jgi:hypothetical protein